MRWLLFAFVIGTLAGLAQRAIPQQPGAPSVLQVRERADELKKTLRRAFDPSKRAEWSTGFRIALDMGATGTALCLELMRQESHQKRRSLLLAALALTRSQESEDALVQIATLGKRGEERPLALLSLALLANASGSAEPLVRLVGGNEDAFVQVAACLALARKHQRVVAAQRMAASEDAALVACAILTGNALSASDRERWWSDKQELASAHLVRRAFFLAGGDLSAEAEAEQCTRALRTLSAPVVASGRAAAVTRVAAGLRLSRCAALEQSLRGLTPPPPACLLAIGSEPTGSSALRALGWLSCVPTLLPDAEDRHRLAALYASCASFADLRADAAAWEQDREISGTVAQTIALRLLRMRADGREPERMAVIEGAQLERLWLRHACGDAGLVPVEPHPDDALRRAYDLAITRRLPSDAAADALELSLVRARRHPGLTATEAWRLLVRDLLLLGSRYAEIRFARGSEPAALPHGIAADHDEFFEVACELWEFVMKQAPELSPGSRIR